MTASDSVVLTVEFGPVQEFIAESRRTRDLWAGSYILSYLMAHALDAAVNAGATIRRPTIQEKPLYLAVRKRRAGAVVGDAELGTARQVGSLPDTFEALVEAANAEQVAEKAIDAWWAAWQGLAEHVLTFLDDKGWPANKETLKLWNWQIGTKGRRDVWNIRWTASPPDRAHSDHQRRWLFYPFDGLARPQPPGEQSSIGGEKSTIGGERTALHAGQLRRENVRQFWADVSRRVGPYEVRPGGAERLDAINVVKRFFPHVAKDAVGWSVQTSYPSTRSVAVAPWLRQVLAHPNDDLAFWVSEVASALKKAQISQSNVSINRVLAGVAGKHEFQEEASRLLHYDGDVFYPESDDAWEGLAETQTADTRATVTQLRKAAQRLQIAPPSGFFAILVIDGDRLTQANDDAPDRAIDLSRALTRFATEVPAIVDSGLGQAVYAGGDDVLALVPSETALATARQLRDRWRDLMASRSAPGPTISAGIVYAQVATPLGLSVRRAHQILDEVAKEQVGRDAFAVEVWTPGGRLLTVGRPWERSGADTQAVSTLEEIVWATAEVRLGHFSNRFLYKLQPLIETVESPGEAILGREQEIDLFLAERLANRQSSGVPRAEDERVEVARLLALLRRWSNRSSSDPGEPGAADGRLEWEMARFVRFLVEGKN